MRRARAEPETNLRAAVGEAVAAVHHDSVSSLLLEGRQGAEEHGPRRGRRTRPRWVEDHLDLAAALDGGGAEGEVRGDSSDDLIAQPAKARVDHHGPREAQGR